MSARMTTLPVCSGQGARAAVTQRSSPMREDSVLQLREWAILELPQLVA